MKWKDLQSVYSKYESGNSAESYKELMRIYGLVKNKYEFWEEERKKSVNCTIESVRIEISLENEWMNHHRDNNTIDMNTVNTMNTNTKIQKV